MPSKTEIARFLEAFYALDEFEAQQQFIRGYGAFGHDWKRPDQSVVNVLKWLTELRDAAEPAGRDDG